METEARKKFLAERDRLMRESVASARVQPVSSDKVLSPKERARLKHVQETLAKGESPYKELGDKGQVGGSVSDKPTERPIRERSEAETSRLEQKWAGRNDPSLNNVELDDLDLGPMRVEDPLKHYCSFCHIEVSASEVTIGVDLTPDGRVLLRKASRVTSINRERKEFTEEVRHFSKKHKACPEHALLIRKVDFKSTESEG